jgi:enterochelin esterase-like enzyme
MRRATNSSRFRRYGRGVTTVAALLAAALLPGFTPVSAGSAGGQVLQGRFPGTPRTGFVYLPPAFTTGRRYPVAYLLHGMPGSPMEYVDGTGLAAFADAAIAAATVRPFIAVMPAAGPDRDYDGEWAGSWERALVQRVVPWVDAHLPTEATAGGRVLAGLSAGGYGAVDIGLRHPNMFRTLESWSGYFSPLRDGPLKHATAAGLAAHDPTTLVGAERAALVRARTRFFVSTGPAHSRWAPPHATLEFAHELRSLGLPCTLRTYPGRAGEWSRQLAAGLRWAFPRA